MSGGGGAPDGVPMEIQNGGSEAGEVVGQNGRKSEKESYAYKQSDSGPFKVMVEKKEENAKFGINKISVGLVLKQNGFSQSVIDIKKVGRTRVMVYLSKWQEANRLLHCQNLKMKKLNAYIPRGFVTVKGVIAGIPEDMDDKEVIEEIETNLEIVEAFRMQRMTKEGKRVPTMRMGVVFRSNKLPASVIMCNACLRYGHIAKYCKGRKRCNNCGESHDNEDEQGACEKKAKCAHCKGEHKASDAKCPERGKQENIKRLMAVKNLSYHEAREQVGIPTRNMFTLLSAEDEYPSIYESFASVTKKREQNERQQLRQQLQQHTRTASPKKAAGQNKKPKNKEQQQADSNWRNSTEDQSCEKDEEGFEVVRYKKRKAESIEKENNEAGSRISMQQHLELRKRWDNKMKEMAEQKEELKSKVNEAYKQLYHALNTKDEEAHQSLLGALNSLGQTLGFRAEGQNSPDSVNG
nr:axoneme-associated protein mst101(2)-like [Aedes albopictus]